MIWFLKIIAVTLHHAQIVLPAYLQEEPTSHVIVHWDILEIYVEVSIDK